MEAFRVMSDDVDGTGKVKVSELKNILTRVGQKFTEEEADAVDIIADAKQDTCHHFSSITKNSLLAMDGKFQLAA